MNSINAPKLIIIEKLESLPSKKQKLCILLEQKEDLWTLRLQTVAPKDLIA